MKTVIMAGGKGTRISEMFPDIPKPLIPIDGVPVLEREIISLHNQGFDDIIITISHMGDKIKEYFEDGNSIKTSRKTDLFRTHFISLRDNEYLADNLVKAFKKAGYKIEKGYWYD